MSPEKQIRNLAASIRARLLNIARQHRIDFNRVLLMYFQQCFLERLAHSKYREKFVLKGGLLFYGVESLIARPTKDIDFLGGGILNQPEEIEAAIREIAGIELPDGVEFFPQSIRSEIIAERGAYSGVRIVIRAALEQARQNLQIDVGFGDRVVPKPVEFEYPDLLSDKKIRIYAYSWSSVIAEKFEAIVSFSDLNSRMKDYYDIYYLQRHFNFDGTELSRAIKETFKRRGTDVSDADYIFSKEFAESKDKQRQWQAFLKKNNLSETDEFPTVIGHLRQFLKPVVSAIMHSASFDHVWNFKKQQWIAMEKE